ncbi:hypothetical protein CBR_g31190 [Chara braunii]|uniref:Peptidase S49 domain-containing protein n=1 Tax=Chara braunii TaxID=69332 RepID=A0A388JXK6_CHABU|nr:hypothetical protein CBR_g31190 [Chara braunii]|eukprot:GBG62551.1 hypothetical protein CBR_g31190 [Chara braunii]
MRLRRCSRKELGLLRKISRLVSLSTDNKAFKAVVVRIDSPGGDALASDLMWRELRLLSEQKPVIASMSDVAASGGYYMAMGTNVIVAEKLTLTGSIGVVSAKINLGNLYKKIGFNKEVTLVELSRQEPTLGAILSSAATVIGWPAEIRAVHKLSKFLIVLASVLDELSLPSATTVPRAAATTTLPQVAQWMAPDGVRSADVRLAADSLAGGWEGSLLPQSLIQQLGDDN